mmetsp:Transcript_34443/g.94792  ORF Transcript_34443/g.94792 Transcript_34443/m.94792 type:complete len:202 (+) Transcript_34443:1551-2156(+)
MVRGLRQRPCAPEAWPRRRRHRPCAVPRDAWRHLRRQAWRQPGVVQCRDGTRHQRRQFALPERGLHADFASGARRRHRTGLRGAPRIAPYPGKSKAYLRLAEECQVERRPLAEVHARVARLWYPQLLARPVQLGHLLRPPEMGTGRERLVLGRRIHARTVLSRRSDMRRWRCLGEVVPSGRSGSGCASRMCMRRSRKSAVP